jgi:pectate lyase
MPMARVGMIHILNNYYSSSMSNYCINSRMNSEFLVEGNYFDKGVIKYFTQKDAVAVTWTSDNYVAEATDQPSSFGVTVSMPYDYKVIPVTEVPSVVKLHAGATLFR